MGVKKKPTVGTWALHKSGTLDSREVFEVSEDGSQIRILIHDYVTDWLPAANYTYHQKG